MNGGAQYMPYAVHPGPLAAFEMRIDNGNPFVYLLQRETMVLRRQDGLSDECSIGVVRPLIGVGAWRQLIRGRLRLIPDELVHGSRRGDYINKPSRRGGSRR
jgi:hypothetical protein